MKASRYPVELTETVPYAPPWSEGASGSRLVKVVSSFGIEDLNQRLVHTEEVASNARSKSADGEVLNKALVALQSLFALLTLGDVPGRDHQ